MEFAERVGCNYTMASRLRSGKRNPSATMLVKIVDAFGLDYRQTMLAYAAGPRSFAAFLQRVVFLAEEPEGATPPALAPA